MTSLSLQKYIASRGILSATQPLAAQGSSCIACHAVAAMEAEALPLVSILGLKEDDPPRIAPPAPAVSYSGTKFGITVHLVRNGTSCSCLMHAHAHALPPQLPHPDHGACV